MSAMASASAGRGMKRGCMVLGSPCVPMSKIKALGSKEARRGKSGHPRRKKCEKEERASAARLRRLHHHPPARAPAQLHGQRSGQHGQHGVRAIDAAFVQREHADRKSTRLNSSHLVISYAVFCLKKKKKRKYHHLDQSY